MSDEQSPSLADRLVGWKRIAGYLGCSERSARRWESEEGLPVHRQQHETKSTVYALPGELDAWVADRSTAPTSNGTANSGAPGTGLWQPSRLFLAIAAMLLVALVVIFVPRLASPPRDDTGTSSGIGSSNAEAVDLYDRGVGLWKQRGREPNERAIKLLTAAVEKDENFAEGWSALASAWATYPSYHPDISPDEARDRSLVAAQRALELDPSLAEPRTLMAEIAQRNGDWKESQRIFEEAIAVKPDSSSIHLWYAAHFRELGMFEQAQEMSKRALKLEPGSPPALIEIAMNSLQGNNTEDGERILDHVTNDIGLKTPVTWVGRWFIFETRKDWDAMRRWAQDTPFTGAADLLRRYIDMISGNGATRNDDLAPDIVAGSGDLFPPWFAYYLLEGLDRPMMALEVAEAAQASGDFDNKVILFHNAKTNIRSTERFADLVDAMGMVDYWRENGLPTTCASEAALPYCQRITKAD